MIFILFYMTIETFSLVASSVTDRGHCMHAG